MGLVEMEEMSLLQWGYNKVHTRDNQVNRNSDPCTQCILSMLHWLQQTQGRQRRKSVGTISSAREGSVSSSPRGEVGPGWGAGDTRCCSPSPCQAWAGDPAASKAKLLGF